MRYIKQKEIFIISIIYILISVYLQFNNLQLFNIINPIFYILFSIYIIYTMNDSYIRVKSNKNFELKMLSLVILYLIIFFFLGFFIGFTKTLYNQSFIGILKNIFPLIVPIIGVELIRCIIVNKNRRNNLVLISITILTILLEIKYNTLLANFENKELFFKYICSVLLPLIASSSLYTYLSSKASYKLPFIFRVIEKVVLLLLPITPNTDWFVQGSLGIIIPVLIYFLFKYRYIKDEIEGTRRKNSEFSKVGFVLAITVSSFLIAFMLGLFKYEPIAILSNSMLPTYSRGDAVVYEKMSDSELQKLEKNSIIVYRIGNQYVAHRIIEVVKDNGVVSYRTMGDNNNAPDGRLVEVGQIKGVYVFSIKYIGFPSVWLNDYFNHESAQVETK